MLVINPSSTYDMSSSELDDMYSFSFSESGSYSSMYVSNTKYSILYKIDTIHMGITHVYTLKYVSYIRISHFLSLLTSNIETQRAAFIQLNQPVQVSEYMYVSYIYIYTLHVCMNSMLYA